jgi:filamentous hemagglutinin
MFRPDPLMDVTSETAEAQFWALEHPSTPGFAQRYGIPPQNVSKLNFIETGVLKPGTPFVTQKAPAVGMHKGGAIEVVVPKGGVELRSFHHLGGNP